MAPAPRLDTLPLELREKIVSLGSIKTLFQISLTSRALHQACQSLSVTKAILYNHNGYGGRKWRYPCLPLDAPVSDWAQWALADLEAQQTSCNTESNSNEVELERRQLYWAPQLMVLQRAHYPVRLWGFTKLTQSRSLYLG